MGRQRNLTITSINDSKHSQNSRHYRDEAVDLRSKDFESREAKRIFRDLMEWTLNKDLKEPKFRALFENEDEENEHFHIQVRKDESYP